MKKITILFAVLLLLGVFRAHAQTQEPQFPIQELGGCATKDACKTFCSDPANSAACVSYAKAHSLVSPDQQRQIDQHDRILRVLQTQGGPGACRTEADCKAYCSDASHADECRAFAESISLPKMGTTTPGLSKPPMPPIKGPAGCASESDCKAYCQAHIDECLKFVMNNLRACQMPKEMPPGLKNNPNGIPDNFRNMGSTTRPNMGLPPPKPLPPQPTSYNGRSYLGNILNALLGK